MKSCEINVAKRIGTVTHVATGSLYGVIENAPCRKYISEIRPGVIGCSPLASETSQQNFGDAVSAAEQVREFGGKLQIRLSEFFPGWYDYYGLEDWFQKLTWAVQKMKRAKIDNIHCYEIWNEPDGTWKGQFLVSRTDTMDYHLMFRVTVPESGEYQITMRYANGGKEHLQWMSVNGGENILVRYPVTGGWYSSGGYGDISWKVNLKAGLNTIKFSRAGNGYIELDYLDVQNGTPVRYEAEISVMGGFVQQTSGFASSRASGHQTFDEFYSCSHRKMRELAPDEKLLGPCLAVYTSSMMRRFLEHQKKEGTLPDIICWHQLADENFTENINDYRRLEKELGISVRPVAINEYSGGEWHEDEGKPGACAPLIAKFERYSVESACQSFWNVPGRLGSLLTDDGKPNGGYWFYKWYAEMSGEMVEVSPPEPEQIRALDAFACVDEKAGYISILFGGETNGGTMDFLLKGLPDFLGDRVFVTLERTRFNGRKAAVPGAEVIERKEYTFSDGELLISLEQLSPDDGYRIYITSGK